MSPDSLSPVPASIHAGLSVTFDVSIATVVGVNSAVVYSYLYEKVRRNACLGVNVVDGKAWTAETYTDISNFFPFLKASNVNKAIKNLIRHSLISHRICRKNNLDKSIWYSIKEVVR